MPTLTDIADEVKTLAHQLNERVDFADKEQKARGEELTSKVGIMAAEYKTATDAMNQRLNELEDQLKEARVAALRPPLKEGKSKSPEHIAFMKALKARGDIGVLSPEEKALIVKEYMPAERKALYAADATTGGFFASTDFVEELQAYVLLTSPMRQICRVQKTSGEKVQMPSLANDTTVYWATEQASFTDSNDPTFGMLSIPVHEARGLLKVSQTNLEDSMFDLESFVKQRLGKKFAQKEGTAFVNGSGAGQPRGILSYPIKASSGYTGGSAGKNNVTDAIAYVASGQATNITADSLLNVLMDLKSDYEPNASFVFTRSTLNTIRLFKDSLNRPLWVPFGAEAPGQIYGRRYVEMPDVDEIGANKYPIIVGDFDNYMIVDRVTVNFQQLNELYAASGLVGFIARMRVGGDVLLPESFRVLKCATS